MANTYTQLYVHIVFATKGRQSLIPKQHKEEIHKYITGIVRNRKQKLIAVHCMPDHTHLFVGFKPTITIADLVRDVKTASSSFIKEKKITPFHFSWQEGYGAFTHSHAQLSTVASYIENQETHHQRKSFKEEYLIFLDEFAVEYDDRYLFDFLD